MGREKAVKQFVARASIRLSVSSVFQVQRAEEDYREFEEDGFAGPARDAIGQVRQAG